MDEARQVRQFWFGHLPLSPLELKARMTLWFGDGDAAHLQRQRDETIAERFGALLERAARGELDAWADGPRRRLSLILLFDQFTRNIHRGTVRAFAHDEQAL